MTIKKLDAAKRTLSVILFSLSFLFTPFAFLKAQEKQVISPDLQLQFFKVDSGQRILKATLTYSKNRMVIPVTGLKVSLFNGMKVKISDLATDKNGQVSQTLSGPSGYINSKDGAMIFSAAFEGNDTITATKSEITVKDLILEMITSKADSIKTITLKARISVYDKKIPAEGVVVAVYVPRMFSLLPVGEVTTDADGIGTLEFPSDIPGDKEENITIVARIEDNPDFGNVEKSSVVKWGKVVDYKVPAGHRALWTKTAPWWMIITLTILLSGVWGHYFYAIISLIRIKRNSQKQKNDAKYIYKD